MITLQKDINMNWDQVKNNIEIKSTMPGLYEDVIEDVYNNSSHMKEAIDAWVSKGNKIYVDEEGDVPSANPGKGKIHIPSDWFLNNHDAAFFSEDGKLHLYNYEQVFSHELMHAVKGTVDTDYQNYFDWSGGNVTATNLVWHDLKLPIQKSYTGTMDLDEYFKANVSYTDNFKVDKIAVAGTFLDGSKVPLDLSEVGKSNDLIIGSADDETLIGGFGRDFLYGRDGNDRLAGDDVFMDPSTVAGFKLNDDGVTDHLYGGNGHDMYGVSGGFDGYNLDSPALLFKYVPTPDNNSKWVVDWDNVNKLDVISDLDGDGEIWSNRTRYIEETNLGYANTLNPTSYVIGIGKTNFEKSRHTDDGYDVYDARPLGSGYTQAFVAIRYTDSEGHDNVVIADGGYDPIVSFIIQDFKEGDFGISFA